MLAVEICCRRRGNPSVEINIPNEHCRQYNKHPLGEQEYSIRPIVPYQQPCEKEYEQTQRNAMQNV